MLVNEDIIKNLIANQHRAIRYHSSFALGLIALGVVLFLFGSRFAWFHQEVGKLAAGFITTLSAFPIKEILSRKDKIGIFQTIQVRLSMGVGAEVNDLERQKIDELFWQVVEKTALQ